MSLDSGQEHHTRAVNRFSSFLCMPVKTKDKAMRCGYSTLISDRHVQNKKNQLYCNQSKVTVF
jgi:hypothetical protein